MKTTLVKAIRRRKIGMVGDAECRYMPVDGFFSEVDSLLEGCVPYSLDAPLNREEWEELTESARIIDDAVGFKLPFPQCLFETPFPNDEDGAPIGRMAFIAVDVTPEMKGSIETKTTSNDWKEWNKDLIDDGVQFAFPDFELFLFVQTPDVDPPGFWRLMPGTIGTSLKGRPIILNTPLGTELYEKDPNFHESLAQFANRVFYCMLTLLATRGVQTRKEPLPKTKKLPLAERERPENSQHIIRIVLAREQSTHAARRLSPGERHKMRLHKRRGHWRKQAYGRNYSKRRWRWIHPMLVGYEGEGTIESEYEICDELPDHKPSVLGTDAFISSD